MPPEPNTAPGEPAPGSPGAPGGPPGGPHAPAGERRRRLTHRLLPALLALALTALGLGVVVGSGQSAEERTARSFAALWKAGNYDAMWRMLTPAAQRRFPRTEFAEAYRSAAATATATRFDPGEAQDVDGGARFAVRVATTAFGAVGGMVELPIRDERVDWRPELVFPGLRAGEELTRETTAPLRGKILDRDGKRIVSGPAKARRTGDGAAASIAGAVEPPETEAERTALYEQGFPEDTPVGTSGLERALEREVRGRPGGELLAGSRRLAATEPGPAGPVRSTIDLDLQTAAETALAGRFGGIAAIDPRSSKVRALAGIAFSAPQPPGSIFKVITVTAALERKLTRTSKRYPVETGATIDGVGLSNANGESCGGNLIESFAHSCNSVFAPMGVDLGAERLVEAAERFGFNEPPLIPGAAGSTIPPAEEIDTPLAVGSSAIGQGKVLATPLEMAVMAGTIANGGVRRHPTLLESAPPSPPIRVTTRRVARTVERLMIEVVRSGTGTAASLAPDAEVAGKTGTAELGSTVGPTAQDPALGPNTDAWFVAYAPTRRPKLAVGVLFVKAGAGGDVAAPAARTVLEAAVR